MANNNENKILNVPNLRFPEFTGEWKKYRLDEMGESFIGLTYSPKDVVENEGTIVFRSSNIQNGQIDYSDIVRVSKTIKERIITRENDLLICARNGSPRLIGKNALIKKTDANNTFGAFMMVYRSIDNDFIHPLLSTRRYVSQVGENLGARINQITTSDLNSFEFFFPKDDGEKRKIGKLFDLLNERIATQNKIIDKLQSLISGIIQNAIQKGLNDNTWEMIYLSKLLTERKEKNSNGYEVNSVSVSEGVINQIEYLGRSFAASDTSKYNVVRYGDIVYTKSPTGNFPYGIIKQSFQKHPVAVSPLYGVYEPYSNEAGCFLHYYFLSSIVTTNYLSPLIQKGAKNTINISNQTFLNNMVPYPKEEVGIRPIAELLRKVQIKLNIERLSLVLLEQQKTYLSQSMFI